jgi:MFS family permease
MQGVGGSGIYSLVGVVAVNVIHPLKFAKYMAVISSVMAISSILGPLLGGVINQQSTWRWVFLLKSVSTIPRFLFLYFEMVGKWYDTGD